MILLRVRAFKSVRRQGAPGQARRPQRRHELVWHQARYDLLAFMRNKQARFATMILPLLFLFVFVSAFGDATVGAAHAKAASYYVPGVEAMSIISASFVSLVISITAQRETGVLKRRRATPVPASVLIGGRVVTGILVSLANVSLLVLIGRVAYDVHPSPSALPAVALTTVFGAAAFSSLAYALSTQIRSTDGAQPIIQALILPLYLISGIFVPAVNLPHALRRAGEFFPVEHLANALHHANQPAISGTRIAWHDLAVLAVWALAGIVVAARTFSWTPSNESTSR